MSSKKKSSKKPVKPNNQVKVYKDKAGDFRYNYYRNGKLVDASTEGFRTRAGALKNLALKYELACHLGIAFLIKHLGAKRINDASIEFASTEPRVKVIDARTGEILNKPRPA